MARVNPRVLKAYPVPAPARVTYPQSRVRVRCGYGCRCGYRCGCGITNSQICSYIILKYKSNLHNYLATRPAPLLSELSNRVAVVWCPSRRCRVVSSPRCRCVVASSSRRCRVVSLSCGVVVAWCRCRVLLSRVLLSSYCRCRCWGRLAVIVVALS